MSIQAIVDLVAICAKKGVKNAILSPGSRCAPLTIAFARHPEITTRTISDERSAAFVALGMAQQLEEPVVLVCTSGSAALNYFPAIAEAYFQEAPLLILTADRPPEWIDQWDGQTIFQPEVYGKHVKKFFQFPDSFETNDQLWYAHRIVNEAINLSKSGPQGPIHINIPLREPFYPKKGEGLIPSSELHVFDQERGIKQLSENSLQRLQKSLTDFSRILIVPGQQKPNPSYQFALEQLIQKKNTVVVSDCISNLQVEGSITFHDHWLGNSSINEKLKPDLVITFGKSLISKSLKLFLRNQQVSHWHIQAHEGVKDTFQHLNKILDCEPAYFLNWLVENLPSQNKDYLESWQNFEKKVQEKLPTTLESTDFGEYPVLHKILPLIPTSSKIHLANSMAVRYVNFLGKRSQEIICNRGTSGIDGTNSTAVGCALTTSEFVTIITGDLAFFYDRNAFWNNYETPNLRIILLNNHAGGIFRLIEGPKEQPELEEYFETHQALTAKFLAEEHEFQYSFAKSFPELERALKDFYEPSSKPKILEIETESSKNAEILKSVKAEILNYLKNQ
ncbi:2-succinyl-5-enolpyruvyl-6-hydroxy-3-cyclohexene-1-carboxylic-acid synthase [Algoriphagus kandeliae]|uniref:2-succinyl-5-enolpyruvyl-6-hydroxy-3-cyclohexene-1-carboxylate synthase n=1 Tax=Algoriphagus kandeliae TaxID=2562278 RepID=A0A4Y9QR92_9BACT|nr:2-succinyl-5-enolpyruvyl-6-hydroxy-3-cyclohexene-1-carboxylic-acid synthase [Algoriphagus kandeliae]TFV94122.1 2-succinyl-5-enolpyruvyl-6-hydroxy-3-cyclohexene-1-carboxylic-acid synthase [Algoriphagus kandeliae]